MSFDHWAIQPAIAAYVNTVSVREPGVLRRLREETAPLPMARMQITPEEGQFLSMVAAMLGARRTLEIGVFTGYSTLCVASALPEGGQVIACDVSEEWTSIGRRYWQEAGVAHKIDLRLAPATETLDRLLERGETGAFDFAFIDADKANYDAYYERCLRLLRPGGVIAIDNVLWHGRVIDASVQDADTLAIRALNEKIHRDERVDVSMLAIGDGLTLARNRG